MAAANEPTEGRTNKTAEELEEVRASIVAQEHRFLRILYNYWLYRPRPREDKLRGASASALLWGLLPSAATSTTGAVAFLGLYLAYSANGLLAEQNELTREQNAYLQRQIEIQTNEIYQSRKAALVGVLYDKIEDNENEGANRHRHSRRARAEAATTLASIERERGGKIDLIEIDLSEIDLEGADLSGALLKRANLYGVSLAGANLKDADLAGANLANANLRGATLTGARLDGAVVFGASQSDSTIWPSTFNAPSFGVRAIVPIAEADDPLTYLAFTSASSYATEDVWPSGFRALVEHELKKLRLDKEPPDQVHALAVMGQFMDAYQAGKIDKALLLTALRNSIHPYYYETAFRFWQELEFLNTRDIVSLAVNTVQPGSRTDLAAHLVKRGLVEATNEKDSFLRPTRLGKELISFVTDQRREL